MCVRVCVCGGDGEGGVATTDTCSTSAQYKFDANLMTPNFDLICNL